MRTVRVVDFGSDEYEQMFVLRDAVLRKPLGRSLTEKDREIDQERVHLAAMENGRVCGTTLLQQLSPEEVQFRQVAVGATHQSQGIGGLLMEFAEDYSRKQGYRKVIVHARGTAIPFYERIGYIGEGDEFEEQGVPHLLMTKNL